jgi:hypothetical protein
VRRVVLHPSTFVAWFHDADDRPLRAEFEAGRLEVVVPPSFTAEAVALMVATGMPRDRLVQLATEIESLGFRVADPPLTELVRYLAQGFSASDAPYAALAGWLEVPLAVSDTHLRDATPNLPHDPP